MNSAGDIANGSGTGGRQLPWRQFRSPRG